MNELQRAEFIVQGLVQGVGYRFFAYRHAEKLELNGYAKNHYDGTVHICVEGIKSSIEEFEKYLHQGPQRSRVENVFTTYKNYKGEFTFFEIG